MNTVPIEPAAVTDMFDPPHCLAPVHDMYAGMDDMAAYAARSAFDYLFYPTTASQVIA